MSFLWQSQTPNDVEQNDFMVLVDINDKAWNDILVLSRKFA